MFAMLHVLCSLHTVYNDYCTLMIPRRRITALIIIHCIYLKKLEALLLKTFLISILSSVTSILALRYVCTLYIVQYIRE